MVRPELFEDVFDYQLSDNQNIDFVNNYIYMTGYERYQFHAK